MTDTLARSESDFNTSCAISFGSNNVRSENLDKMGWSDLSHRLLYPAYYGPGNYFPRGEHVLLRLVQLLRTTMEFGQYGLDSPYGNMANCVWSKDPSQVGCSSSLDHIGRYFNGQLLWCLHIFHGH